ncbi:MAG: RICIN domain-containing protein, partial [Umezawaea sp.]
MGTSDRPPATRRPRGTRWRLGAAAAASATALATTLAALPIASPAEAAVGAGTYAVTNSGSGLCLDAPGTATGEQLQQATCGGGSDQKWVLTAASGGFRISSVASGLCAGVRDA